MSVMQRVLLLLSISLMGLIITQSSLRAQTAMTGKELEKRIDELIQVFRASRPIAQDFKQSLKAVEELAVIGKPAVPKLLEAVTDRDENTAMFSSGALRRIGFPAVGPVRAKWPDLTEEQKWRLMGLRGDFDYQESLGFALQSFESKNAKIRWLAIQHAGLYTEPKARPVLLRMLNTEVPERHRWFIIETLTKIPNDDVADALIALLSPDSWVAKGQGWLLAGFPPYWWPDARCQIIPVLEKIEAKKAAPVLLDLLRAKGPGKGYFAEFILPVLAKWRYKDAIPEMKRVFASGDEYHKNLAAKFLFQLNDRSAMAALLKELDSTVPESRRDACKTIAFHGDNRDVLTLGKCLNDPDDDVQIFACEGLERITGVAIRVPGQSIRTFGVVPLWKTWVEQNRTKYEKQHRELNERDRR
ncbi:MAG: HEAT repeat domain-containing protein [Gemmataceae bacterium]|nr:HEAT repeat domain-containing protein [Gemmataceae bacterium]MCI0741783.1 HEAT repeat domain-containing protein [Gemmataceae bacterium]